VLLKKNSSASSIFIFSSIAFVLISGHFVSVKIAKFVFHSAFRA